MAERFNAASYLVTRNVDEGRGAHPAVLGTRDVSYAELDALCADVAAAYRTAGLRRDDRVMIVMSDDIAMLAAVLGAFRAGVVAVPVSTMLTGQQLGTVLADSGARALVLTAEHAGVVAEALASAPDVEHVVLDGTADLQVPGPVALHSWDDFLDHGAAAPGQSRDPA